MSDGITSKSELWRKMTILLLDIRNSEIAEELNISKSFVSKIISGERKHPEFDSWLISKILNLD